MAKARKTAASAFPWSNRLILFRYFVVQLVKNSREYSSS